MDEYLESVSTASPINNNKPAHLCKRCGICCRIVVPSYSLEEITQMAENNEKEAIDFLRVFVPYNSTDELPEYGRAHYEQIVKTLTEDDNINAEDITVYHCRYIDKNNSCTIYSERPDCCRRAPHTGWSLFAPNCGYAGWQFAQREKHKRNVRKLKEILYEIETVGSKDCKYQGMTIDELKIHIAEKIKPYEKYGAKNW